jgi:hypothetical protein
MARGILIELLSRPDGWETTADDLWRASVDKHGKGSPGRRAFRAAFAELKDAGYLTASREQIAGGRHTTFLTLTDVPHGGTSKEEHGENTEKKNTSSSAPAHGEAFGAFWLIYPKRKNRGEAYEEWTAAIDRGAEPQQMVDAATAYAKERAGRDPQYTKFPATWLRKECYLDDPEPQPQGNGWPPLRAVNGDWKPYTNPTDHSVYQNGWN